MPPGPTGAVRHSRASSQVAISHFPLHPRICRALLPLPLAKANPNGFLLTSLCSSFLTCGEGKLSVSVCPANQEGGNFLFGGSRNRVVSLQNVWEAWSSVLLWQSTNSYNMCWVTSPAGQRDGSDGTKHTYLVQEDWFLGGTCWSFPQFQFLRGRGWGWDGRCSGEDVLFWRSFFQRLTLLERHLVNV